jgi:hypothetical protein
LPVCVVDPVILTDPVNTVGPILVKVDEPDIVSDPVTCKLLVVAHVSLPTKENGCEDPVGP